MKYRYCFSAVCFFVACCLTLIGCSGGGAGPRVSGQVLLDGQPVSEAQVEFQGKGGRSTVTDKDGKFEFDGSSPFKTIKPGTYKVTVTKYVDIKTGQALEADKVEMAKAANEVKYALPQIYADANSSPLSSDVKEGKNELKPFELKSK